MLLDFIVCCPLPSPASSPLRSPPLPMVPEWILLLAHLGGHPPSHPVSPLIPLPPASPGDAFLREGTSA